MPKLINLQGEQENIWTLLEKDVDASAVKGNTLVPMSYFLANQEAVLEAGNIGIWIDSEEQPEELPKEAASLPLIAINFPKFIDGRGYSIARYVRERLGFAGELRAVGDVLIDQLFFYKRCGFSSFLLRDDVDTERALQAFGDFSEVYQAANDQPLPLYRRR